MALLVSGALSLLTAMPAEAHASLVGSTPGAGAVVLKAPTVLRLQFSEVVEVTQDAVRLTAPDGRDVGDLHPRRDPDAADVLVVRLPSGLPVGTYGVAWRVLSIDGHTIQGEFRFANRRATSPLRDATSTSLGGPTVLGAIGRASSVAGALAALGLVAFPLLVVAPVRRRLGVGPELASATVRRLRRPLLVAAVVGVAGTAMVALDTVAGTEGVTASAALTRSGAAIDLLTQTRTGLLLLFRVACLVAVAALFTAVRATPGRRRLGLALVAALGAQLTFALSSHAAAAVVDRPLAVGFDAAHLVASGVWIGGLLALALAGLPAAQEAGGRDRAAVGDAAGALSSAFSVVAALAMLGVITTGGYAALVQITALRDLGDTSWGAELTIKLALWLTILLFAAANAVTFVPTLAGRAGSAGRRLGAAGELGSAIKVELALAAALVGVAALMSATAQPSTLRPRIAAAEGGGPARTATGHGTFAGFTAAVRVVRQGSGRSAATVFRVTLTTERTRASAPSAEALLLGPDGVERRMVLLQTSAGRWTSDRLALSPGTYRFTARFDRLGSPVAIPVRIEVPA